MNTISGHIPTVSVVMPVYNGEKYLRRAVESILSQTFQDFEFIIIDDGSTDSTPAILQSYRDRLQIFSRTNQGLISSLNFGLSIARGEFIARMDADDIALPNRFLKEVEFLSERPDIGMVGSSAYTIDYNNKYIGFYNVDTSDLAIRWKSLFRSPFIHPTVMIRRSVIEEYNLYYDPDYSHAEDYDLWVHLLNHTRAANIKIPLLKYRIHKGSISSIKQKIQLENQRRVSIRTILATYPGFRISSRDLFDLCTEIGFPSNTKSWLKGRRAFLSGKYLELWEAFCSTQKANEDLLSMQQQVILKATRMMLYPPFQEGWIQELSKLEQGWVWIFLFSLLKGFLSRLHEYYLLSLRR